MRKHNLLVRDAFMNNNGLKPKVVIENVTKRFPSEDPEKGLALVDMNFTVQDNE